MSKVYVLCPGQGAQAVGMGKELLETSKGARDAFEVAARVLGYDLAGVCFGGPEDRLNQTDVAQPALFVCGVASFQAAVEAGKLDSGAVVSYAGLSLGEYTALHLAGAFGFEEGLRLVQARGRYMQEAATASPSGMVAVIGADEATLGAIIAESAQGEVLVPANYNAPGQVVISGAIAACERSVKVAEAKGIKAVALKVAGAFHSPLMKPGADKMGAELEKVAFGAPRTPVWSNVTGKLHGSDTAEIKRLLVEQITHSVRWEQTMVALNKESPDGRYVELAPGRTLAGLAKRVNRRLAVESLGG
jgi:[acyl-carrier-protein] S-malonyltransferase